MKIYSIIALAIVMILYAHCSYSVELQNKFYFYSMKDGPKQNRADLGEPELIILHLQYGDCMKIKEPLGGRTLEEFVAGVKKDEKEVYYVESKLLNEDLPKFQAFITKHEGGKIVIYLNDIFIADLSIQPKTKIASDFILSIRLGEVGKIDKDVDEINRIFKKMVIPQNSDKDQDALSPKTEDKAK